MLLHEFSITLKHIKKKVKLSLYEAMEAHKVVRR
jgi:hypothetical protein